VPARAMVGVKLLIVGASLTARTVKGIVLVPEPPDVVTTIADTAHDDRARGATTGTVTTAGVPLKVTVLFPGVALKPTP